MSGMERWPFGYRAAAWVRNTWQDFRHWPGKPYGVTFYEGFVDPRLTALRWRLTGRCLSCGMKRPTHKFGCTEHRRGAS